MFDVIMPFTANGTEKLFYRAFIQHHFTEEYFPFLLSTLAFENIAFTHSNDLPRRGYPEFYRFEPNSRKDFNS